MGLLLRGLSGDPVLGIPPVILYPGWREEDGVITQYFPYRTVAMFGSVLSIVLVSKLVALGFCHQVIPRSWDLLRVFEEKKEAEEDDLALEEKNSMSNTKL